MARRVRNKNSNTDDDEVKPKRNSNKRPIFYNISSAICEGRFVYSDDQGKPWLFDLGMGVMWPVHIKGERKKNG